MEKNITVPATDKGAATQNPKTRDERLAEKRKLYEPGKEISTPDGFINTGVSATGMPLPITISELVGKKVILVDFWTYSCINCQRTTPYLNAWYDKYKDQGLEIIGIHTPEFDFEKVYENVKKATIKESIKFPVVLDNDYSTWTAYKNQYWPRKYLIDIDGFIIYNHIGEGAYEETEKKIQTALKEREQVLGMQKQISATLVSSAIKPEVTEAGSPEIYFGASRNDLLANGNKHLLGEQKFVLPQSLENNRLYLSGLWNISGQSAQNKESQASILFNYSARAVYFVASADTPIRAKVTCDGKALLAKGTNGKCVAGDDITFVNAQSYVTIKDDRLYELIKDASASAHSLKIEVESPGLDAFTFTFG